MASKGKKGPKSAAPTKEAIVQVAVTGDAPRLIPLADGRYVYYFDPLSHRCHHLNTQTAAFAETLREACELGLGPRIFKELTQFNTLYPENGWADRIDDLEMAGVL